MRLFKSMMLATLAGLALSSCIREEALNAEADITDVTVDGTTLVRKPVITNNEVIFYVMVGKTYPTWHPSFMLQRVQRLNLKAVRH